LKIILNNDEWDKFGSSFEEKMSEKITNRFVSDGLNKITEVWGLEVGLILDNLFAGTADCVGTYDGIPSLIDFKTAKKIKKERMDWRLLSPRLCICQCT
jgi:genome maintenance exonuclease 1